MTSGAICPPTSFLLMPAALAACLVAFIAVGIVIASALWNSGWKVRPPLMSLLVFGCGSALGYGFFWVYLANAVWGKLATLMLVVTVSAYFIEAPSRRRVTELIRIPDLWIPLGLCLSVGLFLTTITYVGAESYPACLEVDLYFVNRRLQDTGSPDYLIQKVWVDGLANGTPLWNQVLDPAVARTTVADRPPLLAGIVLIFNSLIPQTYRFAYFMAMTSSVSLTWIPAIWALARTSGLSLARTSALVVTLAFVFYFWFSTIFSWPKALSGGLFIGAFLLLFHYHETKDKRIPLKSVVLGAGFAGLSFVSHFSAGLLLVVTGMLLMSPKRWLGPNRVVVGALIFLAIALPYVTLKSGHETSSSHLAKYTFTGDFIHTLPQAEFDSMSTLDAVRKFYSTLTLQEIVENKYMNIAGIFDSPCLLRCADVSVKRSREMELWPILGSLKLFNFGWFILVPLIAMGSTRLGLPPHWNQIRSVARDCLLIASSGLLGFSIVAYGSVSNIVSSGFMLLLAAAVGVALFSVPWPVIGLFSLLVAANFLWFTSQIFGEDKLILLYPMLVFALLTVFGMLALTIASARIDRTLAAECKQDHEPAPG